MYPELRATIVPIFELLTSALDSELQQRAVEYLHLPELREEVALVVLETMPAFPERDSILEAKLKKAQVSTILLHISTALHYSRVDSPLLLCIGLLLAG